jgi:DNA-binding transcriptional MerR regulator
MRRYTRKELADSASVGVETLRYYEKRGLLPLPEREANNYRSYDGRYLQRLRFIALAKRYGYSLSEIKELLGALDGGRAEKREIRKRLSLKIREIESKISGLLELKDLVRALRDSKSLGECEVFSALAKKKA